MVTRRAGVGLALAATGSLAGAALLAWAVVVEPGRLVVRETRVLSRRWPADRPPLRIAVLTDLHVGSFRNGLERLDEVVARTNAARPDLVVLLGDFVIHGVMFGRFVPPEAAAARLAGLRAPYGIVAVLGNHDWWLDGGRIRRDLEGAGIRVLENDATPLGEGPRRFWVAGLGDLWTRPVSITRALSGVPAREPVLLLTHSPDVFPDVPPRVALTLAGHTHGGQVALPILGRPVVPSRYGQRYAQGLVIEDGRALFVSPGIGTSLLPVRFGVPPEISMVTLAAAE
ncbi:MAG: metallophosphoesterase [Acidobacteria bacterium]|nr:MAG: metallophosphoesterase [Acidobacteriota bacterium]